MWTARCGLSSDIQSQLLYHKLGKNRATRAYDESHLEGVVPIYDGVLQKVYDGIEWDEWLEQEFKLSLKNKTNKHVR